MIPVLEELQLELGTKATAKYMDTRTDAGKSAAEKHEVQMVRTHLFLDAAGNEVHRHVGHMTKEEIRARLETLGLPEKEK